MIRRAKHRLRAEGLFRRRPFLRTSQALALGVTPRTLYDLRETGKIQAIGRGVYRHASLSPLTEPDLILVAARCPRGLICLISALHFHGITTQIPHAVDLALPRGYRPPRLEHPPLRVFRFSGMAFTEGVDTHTIDGVPVRITCPEKTVADCFKFRNKVGLDVAVEALKLCRDRKRSKPNELLRYARMCRMEKVMMPYLTDLLL